jgi:hypothetical protein
MIGEIRRLLGARRGEPFSIHLADGGEVRVPTLDHVFIFPTGSRVIVTHDDDTWDILSPLLISRITVDGQTAAPVE